MTDPPQPIEPEVTADAAHPEAEEQVVEAEVVEAVAGGDPQVAVAIFGHAIDGIGRQAVEHRHLARAWRHRLRCSG